MAFSYKMDNVINLLILLPLVECIEVADIHFYKLVVGFVLNLLKVSEITCVSESIKINDFIFKILIYEKSDYMGTNKARTTSDY